MDERLVTKRSDYLGITWGEASSIRFSSSSLSNSSTARTSYASLEVNALDISSQRRVIKECITIRLMLDHSTRRACQTNNVKAHALVYGVIYNGYIYKSYLF